MHAIAAVLPHPAVVQHVLVFASLHSNALNLTDIIKAFAIAAIIGFMALAVIKNDHRGAWLAIPLVIMILIIAKPAGVTALENGGMQVWNTFFG